jgi:hypothetical protein
MKPLVVAVLLFVATSARADHVWRAWCGDPPTRSRGVYDTSQECWAVVEDHRAANACVDTPKGPTIWGKRDPDWAKQGLRTCAEIRRYDHSCVCKPEAAPTE